MLTVSQIEEPRTATIPRDGQLVSVPLASVVTPDVPDQDQLVAADSMTDAHDAATRYAQLEEQIRTLKLEQRRLEVAPGVFQVDRLTKRVHGGHGYLLTDDRESGGTRTEIRTMTCAHCNCVKGLSPDGSIIHARIFREASTGEVAAVHMLPKGAPGYCSRCHAYLCDDPLCNRFCTPLSRALEYNLPIAQREGRESWQFEKGLY